MSSEAISGQSITICDTWISARAMALDIGGRAVAIAGEQA